MLARRGISESVGRDFTQFRPRRISYDAHASVRPVIGSEQDYRGKALGGAILTNEMSDKRREPRYATHNPITFSQLNKSENYIGIVRNFSRSGMFFRSTRKLNPGSCIVIIPLVCGGADLLWGNGESDVVADSVCATDDRPEDPHAASFINMVTARVTRCESIGDAGRLRYGVAVDYIRPMI
jgi:hypothetical protein